MICPARARETASIDRESWTPPDISQATRAEAWLASGHSHFAAATRRGYAAHGFEQPRVADSSYPLQLPKFCGLPVCWRRPKFDPPCRLNFDPGLGAGIG
jgi:hypothetical protein